MYAHILIRTSDNPEGGYIDGWYRHVLTKGLYEPAAPVLAVQGDSTVYLFTPSPITVSIDDAYVGPLTVELSASLGTWQAGSHNEVTVIDGALDTGHVVLQGALTPLLQVLASLTYTPTTDSGNDVLAVTATNSAFQSDSQTLNVALSGLPLTSVWMPPPVVAITGTPTPIPSIQVDDVMEIDLRVTHGTLTIGNEERITVVAGSSGTSRIRMAGNTIALKDVLTTLVYTSHGGFIGVDQLVADVFHVAAMTHDAGILSIIVDPEPGSEVVASDTTDMLDRILANTGRLYGG